MRTGEHQGGPPAGDAASRRGHGERPIAAFDFDGTLTVEDSFVAFLRWRTSPWRWWAGLARLLAAAVTYGVTRDRGRLKGAAVRVFLRGAGRDELRDQAERFAAGQGERLLRPDALERWAEHGQAGDLRVIVTASPEEIVAPFAERLGADALIGSRLTWTVDGCVGDGLAGANCRGAEKVRRLRERFGGDIDVGDAYGDTSGDREMLAFARRGHMRLFTGRPSLNPASATPVRPR